MIYFRHKFLIKHRDFEKYLAQFRSHMRNDPEVSAEEIVMVVCAFQIT